MHYLVSLVFIFLTSLSSLCAAQLAQHDSIRYWQLFDSVGLSLEELIGTPNNNWTALPDGQTKLNALDSDYWKSAQGSTMWIKIELPRIIDTERVWIELAPNVGLNGKMAIYENGVWSWKQPAGRQGSNHANFPANFLTFVIDKPRESRLLFLKVNSTQILHFSVNVRDHDSQLKLLASRNLIYGICFGLMLLATVYNMAIGISANERVYIYYASYVLCMSLYIVAMTGYNRLAFPEWGGDGSFSNLAACLAMFAMTVFVRELLQTKTTTPRLDILLRLLSASVFITIFLLGLISDTAAYICVETIALIIPVVLLVSALGALKQKQAMAKLFLIAWFTHIFTGTLWVWMWLGFIPPTLDILSAFIAGSVTEQLMLSVLLGYNYAHLKHKSLSLAKNNKLQSRESERDPLTGIFTRQGLYAQIERTMKANEKDLIWIDVNIDNFGDFNAKHGIHFGDRLLSEFGQLLQTKVRRDNFAAKLIDKENNSSYRRGLAGRIGGGQFTVVLSNCSRPQARLYVERLVRDFEHIKIKNTEGKWLSASICVGVVSILPNEDFHCAWQRATNKLKDAKSKGQAQLAFS